jgi:hypothetical protein
MKIIKIATEYIGNCKNSFDPDTGDSLIDCFVDVSDFAVKEENGIEISKEEFEKFIKYLDVPREVRNEFNPPYGTQHQLKYFFYDNNIYVLYDQDDDVHYFFQ